MTTGSKNERKATTLWTYCGSNSTYQKGSNRFWTGGDRPMRNVRQRRKVVIDRKVFHLLPEKRNAIGRALELDSLSEEVTKGTIFDRALKSRMQGATGGTTGNAVGLNAFSKTWSNYDEQPLTYRETGTGIVRSGTVANCGYTPENDLFTVAFTADDQYKLIERLRTRIMGSDFNLGSTLGAEGLDTVRYIGDVASRVYRSAIQVKKLNMRGAIDVLRSWGRAYSPRSLESSRLRAQEDIYRSLLEEASSAPRKNGATQWWKVPPTAYLEYQLAVAPLLGDLLAASEQLAWLTHTPRVQRITAQVRKTQQRPTPYTGANWDTTKEVRRRVIAYFTHHAKPWDFSGFQDPEVILWNALPLSFVVDYAYNLGGFLEARGTVNAFPPGIFCTTDKVETLARVVFDRKFQNAQRSPVLTGNYQLRRSGSITRTISTTLAVPRPEVKPFGALSSWRRALTTFSLIALLGDGLPQKFLRE